MEIQKPEQKQANIIKQIRRIIYLKIRGLLRDIIKKYKSLNDFIGLKLSILV